MISRLERIINNQLELHDSLRSYDYSKTIYDPIYEDHKGTYKIKTTREEVPCMCHPETCHHSDGTEILYKREKIYMEKVDKNPDMQEYQRFLNFLEKEMGIFDYSKIITKFMKNERAEEDAWKI